MQGKDGGWAAFDVDNNWQILSHVPFADHNAMLDPSCPDITGRVIEALMRLRLQARIILRSATAWNSCCEPRSRMAAGTAAGASIIFTARFWPCAVFARPASSENEPSIQRALEFIRAYQNRDGGWGESCSSYDENRFMPNPSTPSQTAWGILALLAGGDLRSESLYNGVEYLVRTQNSNGTWDEDYCTGTGFPRVFYLSYTEYRNLFPLLALAEFTKATALLEQA